MQPEKQHKDEKIIKTVICIAALISAVSCMNNTKTLLPNVSGKAGEVIIVVGKDNWEGNLGNEIGGLLARDCEYLPQREPLYSLVNLSPGAFSDMFKLHRNIVIFNIDSTVVKQGVVYRTDVWAHPQCVIQVNASCADSAIVVLEKTVRTSPEPSSRPRGTGSSPTLCSTRSPNWGTLSPK